MEVILLAIGVALILYAFYKWATLKYGYFESIDLPYVKPTFIFGSTWPLLLGRYAVDQYFKELFIKFPTAKIFGLFDFRQPFFCLRDPEVIKQLTIKDFDHFEDHKSFADEKIDPLFGNNMFVMRGNKWRDMRAALSPAFTSNKMKQMFELVTETAYNMSYYLKDEASKGKIQHCDMKELFSKYTTDVIASSAFGIKINSFENDKNEFYVTGKKLLLFTNFFKMVKFVLMLMMPAIMKFFKVSLMNKDITDFFRDMVLNNMQTREREGIFRPDMINILMQIKKGSLRHQPAVADDKTSEAQGFATVEESAIGKRVVNREWSDDELVAQCFLFFFAGFETSSTLLSFVAHELAINMDVQEKLVTEVFEVNKKCEGNRVTYDLLQNMKYMDQVISETLRKWPPAAMVDRVCVKDYNYNDGTNKFTIKKGQLLWLPIIALHRNELYFPNPDTFDPERFNDENKGDIVSGSYIPFGIGPRNCIGSRFALMEVKAVIYYLLLNFKFLPNEKTQNPIKLKKMLGAMMPENGFHLELKAR